MTDTAIWDFEIAKFYCLTGSGGSSHITVPHFVEFEQSIKEILQFFVFFIIAAVMPILNVRNRKILLAKRVCKAETHHCAECRKN